MDAHKHFLENDALLHSSESNEKHVLPSESEKGEIILYQPDDKICLEVRLEEETVWLTQAQIADLFGVKQPAISKHLSNIFKSGELDEKRVYSILEYTATDGKLIIDNEVWLLGASVKDMGQSYRNRIYHI